MDTCIEIEVRGRVRDGVTVHCHEDVVSVEDVRYAHDDDKCE